ncbi:Zinc ABC transporter, periplasmic-binding protein ZnuA [Alloactinosynnema sp. L-07]|uniref:metal ABC transporter solute-binding protein, Zn/Mn family n=1 Tax=Alloactinosynnema sp. L-07 TaxID=1653480 RepID=UPI00065EF2EF|nr:zinc ABC transporter substrate-binding protein [Alloactinosynnema sp. L-07]CRK61163.1 Zinc ABC transporter, periplasmic-binding protein ZnuA [Alloactinosynnema sp. L-07]
MTIRPSRSVAAGVAVLTLLGVTACGEPSTVASEQGKTVVVTSTVVWGSVVRAIGGERVAVRSIISDPAGDPHGYEAKPADSAAFQGAKLAVSNGGGYDDFFAGLANTAGGDLRKIVAVDSNEKIAADGSGRDHANEHVWYDFHTVEVVAGHIADELSAVDPANKAEFAANAEAFGKKIEELAAKAEAIGKARPGVKIVASEPVAGLLLEHAGLTDATPEEFAEAIEEETDPPAAAVAATEALVTEKQVAALIYNEQAETPVTKSIKDKAVAAGIPVVTVTETLPPGVTSYLDWMTKQVESLSGALAVA